MLSWWSERPGTCRSAVGLDSLLLRMSTQTRCWRPCMQQLHLCNVLPRVSTAVAVEDPPRPVGRSLRPAETVMLERDIWKIAFKSLRKDPAYPPLARFGPTLDGHNSGPFPLHSCKFELYPAYLTPSVSSVPQILRRYSWTAWPLPRARSLLGF